MNDAHWMQLALEQARFAASEGEVPVGAVLVLNDECIATGHNQPIKSSDPSAHAEIIVLRKAGQQLGNYRLNDATLYVTLEPCAMCAGALVHARIKRLVYGAQDLRAGACGTVMNIAHHPELNHRINVEQGPLVDECRTVLQNFFRERRSA